MSHGTVWEKLGASLGMWTVLWIGLLYLVLSRVPIDLEGDSSRFAAALDANRSALDWVTLLTVVGGLAFGWFVGSLVVPLRAAEGAPWRLSRIAHAMGLLWTVTWLLSALFNSASLQLASRYHDPAGARLAAILARETPLVLTPSILFALTLAVAYIGVRFGGLPAAFVRGTAATSALLLVLALVEWYGPGNLGGWILALGLGWTGATSAVLLARVSRAG